MRWGTGSRLWVTWDGRTRLGCDEALGYNTACPSVGAKVGRAGVSRARPRQGPARKRTGCQESAQGGTVLWVLVAGVVME